MSVLDTFKDFQKVVNADIEYVREARARRDLFRDAFSSEDDVVEVVPSGSLARGTHKDPIHDVDVIVIFDADDHPEWGSPGASAADALNYVRGRVNSLLSVTNGTHEQAVRLARWRNHAVKCFLDDPEDPNAFTVDAMPALRSDGKLLIPEAQSKDWVYCNPELLISLTAGKHAEWDKFAGTVRMLKWWATEQNFKVKSLVMEVLALDFLPTDMNQPAAIKSFFIKAAYHIEAGNEVVDPAGLCGPIQRDLDYTELADALREAAGNATKAFQAQANNNINAAITHWRNVFGESFPEPPNTSGNPVPAVVPVTPRQVKDTPQG